MESGYYGLQQKKTVSKVKHHNREFPSKESGKTMYVHHVIFEDGHAGEFIQRGKKLNRNDGTTVNDREEICYIPKQAEKQDALDKLKMCDEAGVIVPINESEENENQQMPQQKKPSVQNTAISFATRYAADCAMVKFKDQEASAASYLDFISTLALGLKDLMEQNI